MHRYGYVKIKVGVALDNAVFQKIDGIVDSSAHLSTNRSEIIGTMLSDFLRLELITQKKYEGWSSEKEKDSYKLSNIIISNILLLIGVQQVHLTICCL